MRVRNVKWRKYSKEVSKKLLNREWMNKQRGSASHPIDEVFSILQLTSVTSAARASSLRRKNSQISSKIKLWAKQKTLEEVDRQDVGVFDVVLPSRVSIGRVFNRHLETIQIFWRKKFGPSGHLWTKELSIATLLPFLTSWASIAFGSHLSHRCLCLYFNFSTCKS